ncbi:MAG: BrnT family toxin [Chloroflexota bacterium]
MIRAFEWHRRRAVQNIIKHRVDFHDAWRVLLDPRAVTITSPRGNREVRFVTIGYSAHQGLLTVVHIERGDRIRLISARPASRKERQDYEHAS